MKQLLLFLFASLVVFNVLAQNHNTRFKAIDILHYDFELQLNDSTDRIEGKAEIKVQFLNPTKQFTLDLVGVDTLNRGMTVHSIREELSPILFNHRNNQIELELNEVVSENSIHIFEIKYSGVPADGLVISKNRYGERTFFGDNWPNRAKYWLPTVDHPSDKSTLEFKIIAPEKYQVVSNGSIVEESNMENGTKLTHWKENVPLSTKLMVIGVARFAVENKKEFKGIPVSNWVFPQNREKGFENYSYHSKALNYFSQLIGPYSYAKLAHVQSKTRYGGMENAGCIFYHERTAISDKSQERLFAHEMAHQWFGNSVSEQNWHHIWLSEGFATYLTHVYNQNFYSEDIFRKGLENDRIRVIKYGVRNLAPIIDTTITNYNRLLNANSYQKASWFLHMLRNKLGDSVFFEGLRNYYAEFQNSTALTNDFKNVMEKTSGKELDDFFHQWLYQPGHPVLYVKWKMKVKKKLLIDIEQIQADYHFSFPLEIEFQYENGETELHTIQVNKNYVLKKEVNNKVKNIILDPNVKLLYDLHIP